MQRASELGVEHVLFDAKALGHDACDAQMCTLLSGRAIDLIILAGPVIATRPVPVHPNDTVATLRERVQAVERDLLTTSIASLLPRVRLPWRGP